MSFKSKHFNFCEVNVSAAWEWNSRQTHITLRAQSQPFTINWKWEEYIKFTVNWEWELTELIDWLNQYKEKNNKVSFTS